ncbi:MAG: TonB family protein [Cyclobacteriaceae bacterium]|nr:TonB family protein [Cyclobacteriaceae bacterium]
MKLKIKIIDKVPVALEEEIKSYMDFDGLFKQHEINKFGRVNLYKNSLITIGIIIGIATGLYFLSNRTYIDNSNDLDKTTISNTNTLEKEKSREIIKKGLELNNSKELIEIPPIKGVDKEEKFTKNKVVEKEQKIEPSEKLTVIDDQETAPEKEQTYEYIEASPVEGLPYLYAYFNKNLTYPDELKKDSIEGVVLVSFSVLKDSTIANTVIIQSLGEQFDNEAIRVVNGMPKWIPATVNNIPVNSKLSVPLTFTIKK